MSVLRTLVYSALGGSILHVGMRAARSVPRALPRSVPPAIVPPPPVALIAAPQIALQVIPETDEPDIAARFERNASARIQRLGAKLIEDFQKIERDGIESCSRLRECELDVRLSSLTETFERQTACLREMRDSTLQRGAKIGDLALEIEVLCERVSHGTILPRGAANADNTVNELEIAELKRRRVKAMFAFSEKGDESQPVPREPDLSNVKCPKCTSRHTRPAYRLSALDRCLRLFCVNAWRCRACGVRFYRVVWAASIDLNSIRRLIPGKAKESHDLAH